METTMNINNDLLAAISRAAVKRGISRSRMIVLILKEVLPDINGPARYGKLICYQERSNPESWHTFHLQVREDDYEFLLDLRKLLKMSVSCILAYAFKRYLKRINTDKNRFKNYVIIKRINAGIIFWTLIWGYPPDIETYLPPYVP
ncbi:MAG TPA: hypothetical protein PLM53_20240 [Spirochaetota bacterium]|nr:hypothetical protein [Spirochaetota bacterium]HPC41460.1 hypothetical protein [Spirochaetota bacterium]HPL17161.1 hypothetical protein [Spirochaetota bacterium]HQF10454.1 hypothetical protein [Spirochaetota bacterium]HQH99425.1 hypothetical protein [Spirochaetota bacterium]